MIRKLAGAALVIAGTVVGAVRPVAAQATSSDPMILAQPAQATPAAQAPVTNAAAAATPAPANTAEGATGSDGAAGSASALSRFGPTADGARLLVPARTQSEERQLGHVPAYRRSAPGVALMIVGGALFLGGAIVEGRAGDALMVGGVVVAALGLYQYLQ